MSTRSNRDMFVGKRVRERSESGGLGPAEGGYEKRSRRAGPGVDSEEFNVIRNNCAEVEIREFSEPELLPCWSGSGLAIGGVERELIGR
jgi:hypothetical protein